jgi:Xaa-Pro aminopeptidase
MKSTTNEPLLFAVSNADADLRWFTQFDCCDPFLAFGARGRRYGLTHRLEYARMIEEGCLDEVLLWDDVAAEVKKATGKKRPKIVDLIRHLQKKYHIASFRVPRNFPSGMYADLRKAGARVNIARGNMFPERAIKTKAEIAHLRESNRVTGLAQKAVRKVLAESTIGPKDVLKWKGKTLTSETLRLVIDQACVTHGGIPVLANIAAPGEQVLNNHFVGTGPIFAHQTLVIDIFPRMAASGYFGDITRTYIKGAPTPEQKKLYNTVRKGQQLAIAAIKDGIDAQVPYKIVVDYFKSQGFHPGEDNGRSTGFRHGLGHGLGLDVHEAPNMGSRPGDTLAAGQVVTVEPGLYYPVLGGVRIEDVVLVTKKGCELLSALPYTWIIK